ncbi:TPA: hypothetical protein ACIBMG_004710, partial [Salmonella enterica subsp. enterica serovar Muenchen]
MENTIYSVLITFFVLYGTTPKESGTAKRRNKRGALMYEYMHRNTGYPAYSERRRNLVSPIRAIRAIRAI